VCAYSRSIAIVMASSSGKCVLYASEAISTIVILLVAIVSSIVSPPAALTFTEQDPAFSFQLTIPETVPVTSLIGLSAGIPIALVLVTHVFEAYAKHLHKPFSARTACRSMAWLALCFAQCMCLTLAGMIDTGSAAFSMVVNPTLTSSTFWNAVTGWIKISVGRQVCTPTHRPGPSDTPST
jgi:hypothetical protein